MGQIIQDEPAHILARVVRPATGEGAVASELSSVIRRFVGDSMRIDVEFVDDESVLRRPGEKFRIVRSLAARSA